MSVKSEAVATRIAQARSLSPKFENIDYQVVHSCKGRLRIRVSRLANDTTYGNRLKSLVESIDCVTSIRLNPAASSLVIKYDIDKAVTPDTLQEQVFTAIEQATARESSQSQNNLPPLPSTDDSNSSAINLAETELPNPDVTEVAEDESSSFVESPSLPRHDEKTSQEYSLLVRGNYSVAAHLKSG